MTLADFSTTKTSNYTPGPGEYDVASYNGISNKYSLKYTIRPKYKEKKSLTSNVDYPKERPGLTPMDKTIGPIIGLRDSTSDLPKSARECNVGPEYVPDPKQFFSKSVQIRNRFDDITQKSYNVGDPGPGQYSPIHYDEMSKGTMPQMGSRGEIQLSKTNDSPGPSAYSVPRNKIETPIFTIRPKTDSEFDLSLKNPNPGYIYNNLGVTGSDSPRWQFPKSQSARVRDNNVPGPGYYDQNPKTSRQLGTKIRPKYKEKVPEYSNVPIENVREFPEYDRNKNYYSNITIGEKIESNYQAKDNKVPGPFFVPTETNIGSKSSTHLKTKIRNKFDDPEHPSPYPTYNYSYTYKYSKDGKEKKAILNQTEQFRHTGSALQQTPGPSDYYPTDPSKDGYPMFSMKGPMDRADWLPKDLGNPGPGQYKIKSENNLPKWSIGDKSRYKQGNKKGKNNSDQYYNDNSQSSIRKRRSDSASSTSLNKRNKNITKEEKLNESSSMNSSRRNTNKRSNSSRKGDFNNNEPLSARRSINSKRRSNNAEDNIRKKKNE